MMKRLPSIATSLLISAMAKALHAAHAPYAID